MWYNYFKTLQGFPPGTCRWVTGTPWWLQCLAFSYPRLIGPRRPYPKRCDSPWGLRSAIRPKQGSRGGHGICLQVMASITGKKMGLAIRGKIMAKHELCWWYFFNTPTETCTIGFGTTLPQQNGLLAVWINKTNEIWEYVYIYIQCTYYIICVYIYGMCVCWPVGKWHVCLDVFGTHQPVVRVDSAKSWVLLLTRTVTKMVSKVAMIRNHWQMV